jgi:hypothetical protein
MKEWLKAAAMPLIKCRPRRPSGATTAAGEPESANMDDRFLTLRR